MKKKLSSSHSFTIEPWEKRLRLIVYEGREELVCRKENLRNLNTFLAKESDHIFKGRLQLSKDKNQISVLVKGENVGVLDVNEFQKILKSC